MNKEINDIPGNYGMPLFGEALSLFLGKQKFFHQKNLQYGSLVKTKIFTTKYLILYDQEKFLKILEEQSDILSSSKGWSLLSPLLGDGILFQDGVNHQKNRRLISSSFKENTGDFMIERIEECALYFLDKHLKNKKSINLYRTTKKFSFSVIASLLFGNLSEQDYQFEEDFYTLLNGQLGLIRYDISFTKYGKALQSKRRLKKWITSKIILCRNSSGELNCILNSLIVNNSTVSSNKISDEELIDQVIQILFAGYETTALLLSWILYILTVFPKEKNKIRSEIKKNINILSINNKDLNKLVYLDKFILETQRLFPPVYTIPRGLNRDLIVDNYLIPVSWKIIFCPIASHRDEEKFIEPLKFIPSRFTDTKLSGSLSSFGHGVHKCLGEELSKLELKIFLSILLMNYDLALSPEFPFSSALTASTQLLKKFKLSLL